MHSSLVCALVLFFACLVKSDNACVCACRSGNGQLHTYENTTADCTACDEAYCREYAPGCGAQAIVNHTCGVASAWDGDWAVPHDNTTCNPETCCCMDGIFRVSSTEVEGKYTFQVDLRGNCGDRHNTTGTIVAQSNSSSVGYTTFENELLYAVNVDSVITFFPLDAVINCLPGPLTCDSGDCKPFPTGVIIAVVVIVVIVLGVGVAVFLWYRKRSTYQSL